MHHESAHGSVVSARARRVRFRARFLVAYRGAGLYLSSLMSALRCVPVCFCNTKCRFPRKLFLSTVGRDKVGYSEHVFDATPISTGEVGRAEINEDVLTVPPGSNVSMSQVDFDSQEAKPVFRRLSPCKLYMFGLLNQQIETSVLHFSLSGTQHKTVICVRIVRCRYAFQFLRLKGECRHRSQLLTIANPLICLLYSAHH